MVAAARAGITRVMLPARNRKDFLDIPDEVREGMSFIWLETVDDAVTAASNRKRTPWSQRRQGLLARSKNLH